MSSSFAIERLLSGPKFGVGIGFRRLARLLNPLLDSAWGRQFSTIKVTGSNGKGSVTALVHSLLRHLGNNSGRFTSPHLIRFHERIVIRDSDITDPQIDAAFEWLESARAAVEEETPNEVFGSFELITALCIRSFFDANVAVGVMEAGIGGRYDPVRLLPGQFVALTSIDLEHTELLGKTKELIAYDKLDICPDGGTVVAIRQDDDLWDRITAYCNLRRVTLVDAREHWCVECVSRSSSSPLDKMEIRLKSNCYNGNITLPLVGIFQLDNIAVACTLFQLWANQYVSNLPRDAFASAITTGLQSTQWPGRFEQIANDPQVFIDVGHSPDACIRLVQTIKTFLPQREILLVTGVSANKSVEDMLRVLTPVAHGVICTRAYHKGETVSRIAQLVHQFAPSTDVWEAGTIEEAVALAKQIATARSMTVLVAGGLFLAIEFHTAWKGSDPRLLRFY